MTWHLCTVDHSVIAFVRHIENCHPSWKFVEKCAFVNFTSFTQNLTGEFHYSLTLPRGFRDYAFVTGYGPQLMNYQVIKVILSLDSWLPPRMASQAPDDINCFLNGFDKSRVKSVNCTSSSKFDIFGGARSLYFSCLFISKTGTYGRLWIIFESKLSYRTSMFWV